MEFLDPKKQRAHSIRIMVGYVLIAIALILTTIILLYRAYGFGVDRNGHVIQNGLVFLSSTPNPADIYINGKQHKDDTNVRLLLSSGQYTVELKRDGYTDWKRAITVEGGSVERFDYPFLFPTTLQTSSVKPYAKQPALVTQSPDRKWLLTQTSESAHKFDMFDLSNPNEINKNLKELTLPDAAFTVGQDAAAQKWELVQWSTDNRHVVLKHFFQKDGQQQYEYVLLDHEDTAKSVNLTSAWGVNPTNVELRDQAYDQYYLFDQASATVRTATLKEPAPKDYLSNVLAFKSYGDDVMLYVSAQSSEAGKVAVKLQQGKESYTIRTLPANSSYVVNLTKYDGDWYMAAGSASEGKVYVYQNPVTMLKDQKIIVPIRILKVPNVDYLAFSSNARFIMAERGTNFAVYDAENDKGYNFNLKTPLDSPQAHATWMDGHRITLTSNGKINVLDFDGANQRSLSAANSSFLPYFDRDYEYLYTLTNNAAGTEGAAMLLQKTPLRTEKDL